MKGLGAPAHGVRERRRADRHDHELLEVDRIVGVGAAVDDIHHRGRQDARRRAADVAVKRQARGVRRRLGDRERYAENGVGAEPRLVRRAVEGDHRLVDSELIFGVEPGHRIEDVAIDGLDRPQDALAAEAALIAVAQLHRFARSGRGARRNGGPTHGAVLENHINLDRRIAAAVEDFTGDDVDDCSHDRASLLAFSRRLLRQSEGARKTDELPHPPYWRHICFSEEDI